MLRVDTSEREIKFITFIVLILSCIGFALSVVALDQHVRYLNGLAEGPSFCNISDYFNCERVNASQWSEIAGVPIASYGMFFYLLLTGCALATLLTRAVAPVAFMHLLLLAGAVSVVGSLGLFALSEFVIKALCPLCLGLYLINISIFTIVWRRVFKGQLLVGLGGSVSVLRAFGKTALGGSRPGEKWAARLVGVGVALLAYWNVKAPGLLLASLLAKENSRVPVAQEDPVVAWKTAPVVAMSLQINAAPFGDFSKGAPSAPIQIVEFADYECGGCRILSPLIHDVLEKYKGQWLFVFRNYPLDQACNASIPRPFHRFACLAAHVSRCAGEQGKFWEANEFLFSAPELEGEGAVEEVRNALVRSSSRSLGLDAIALRECVDSRRYATSIERDIKDADALGLDGTPSIWVNGRKVAEPSIEALEAIFNHILKNVRVD